MKTEELMRYRRMYAAMEAALGTPWLTFAHGQGDREAQVGRRGSGRWRALREPNGQEAFQAPYGRPPEL